MGAGLDLSPSAARVRPYGARSARYLSLCAATSESLVRADLFQVVAAPVKHNQALLVSLDHGVAPSIPIDNPMTTDKVELGMLLFFDPRLSRDGTVSCATCHDPKTGWTDRRSTSIGIDGRKGRRNTLTIINAAFGGVDLGSCAGSSPRPVSMVLSSESVQACGGPAPGV